MSPLPSRRAGSPALVLGAILTLGACQAANPAYQGRDAAAAEESPGPDAATAPDGRPVAAGEEARLDASPEASPSKAAPPELRDAAGQPPVADATERPDTAAAHDAAAVHDTASPPDTAGPAPDGRVDAGCVGACTFTFAANPAACLASNRVAPESCERVVGPDRLNLDTRGGAANDVFAAYLRFVVGGELAGRTISSVRLRFRSVTGGEGEGESSGEVWRVAPFVEADLATNVPAKVGTAPVAPALDGFIYSGRTVEWSLPANLVVAGKALTLGVFPLASDRILYERTGAYAPVLVVQTR